MECGTVDKCPLWLEVNTHTFFSMYSIIYHIGVFTWAVGPPAYWHIHSVVYGLHSIPPLPEVSAHVGMIGPCSPHPVSAKILCWTNLTMSGDVTISMHIHYNKKYFLGSNIVTVT